MSHIESKANLTTTEVMAQFAAMSDAHLHGQELAQQGAIHAISTLLQSGCKEETAIEMLVSLRQTAYLIREEVKSRNITPLFEQDQMNFN